MRQFIRPGLWLGIWIFGWLLCMVLSVITPLNVGPDLDNSDKIGHFLAYGTLAAWAVMIFRTKRAWALSAVGLIFLGIAMEFAQGFLTTTRMMDWHDALANTMGVGLGICLAFLPWQNLLQRMDKRFFARE